MRGQHKVAADGHIFAFSGFAERSPARGARIIIGENRERVRDLE